MKKTLLLIAAIVSVIATQAWELPYHYNTITVNEYMNKNYTVATPSYESKSTDGQYRARMSAMVYAPTGDHFATFTDEGGSVLFYSEYSDGVFVGQRNEGTNRVAYDVNVRAFFRSSDSPAKITNACIKSATITYHSINSKSIDLQSDKTCTVEVRQAGRIVKITPNTPTNTIHLTIPVQTNVKDDSPYSNIILGGSPMAGVIIQDIKFDLVDGKTYEEVIQDYENYTKSLTNSLSFLNTIQNSNGKGYQSAHNGDVNSDGNVNAADVVTIYNNIISGVETYKNHEYVDLGLPSKTLWASCNVGAYSPTGIGDFYAWYEFDNSFFNGKTSFTADSRNYNSSLMAPAGWEGWTMPTKEQCQELIKNTTLTTGPGNAYVILTSKNNGNQLILPTSGYMSKTGPSTGATGFYWIDDNASTTNAGMLKANKSEISVTVDYKYYGNSLRLVTKK